MFATNLIRGARGRLRVDADRGVPRWREEKVKRPLGKITLQYPETNRCCKARNLEKIHVDRSIFGSALVVSGNDVDLAYEDGGCIRAISR